MVKKCVLYSKFYGMNYAHESATVITKGTSERYI